MNSPSDPVTNSSKTHTDLPLLPGGNNGNGGRATNAEAGAPIARLLHDAFEPLPEPPVALVDVVEVREWIERSTAHLLVRRERQNLLSEAMRILDDDWRTAMRAQRLHHQAARQQERLRAKLDTAYWRDRDARRLATRPVHVLVDPGAWELAKAVAAARRSSVGIVVGELLTREVQRPRPRGLLPGPGLADVRLFTRIAVQAETWAATRTLAARVGVTVEQFVGLLVAEHFQDRGR